MTTAPPLDALARVFDAHAPRDLPALPGRLNDREAGVLVPLFWEAEPTVVLNLRPSTMRQHAGEVCFPGGRPEAQDEDLAATALREAHEEIGVLRARILGRLSSVPLYTSRFRIFPFVAALPPQPLTPSPDEVAAVFRLRLRDLLSRAHIDAIPFTWEGGSLCSPVFTIGEHAAYGGTAYVLLELLEVVAPLFDMAVPPLVTGRYEWSDFI